MRSWLVLAGLGVVTLALCTSSPVVAAGQLGAWQVYRHGQDRQFGQVLLPLRDGRLLVTSGAISTRTGFTLTPATEIFDPRNGTWTTAADIPEPGIDQSAVQLPDGTVLVAGGWKGPGDRTAQAHVLSAAEIFSPSTGTWTPAGKLRSARYGAALVLLPDGSAMIIGGAGDIAGRSVGSASPRLASVEFFSPETRTWLAGPNLATGRSSPIAVVLGDGRVLVMGGWGAISGDEAKALEGVNDQTGRSTSEGPILTSELYDPTAGIWRVYHLSFPADADAQVVTAGYALANGQVLGVSANLLTVAGGPFGQPGIPSERYPFVLDPSTGDVGLGPANPDSQSGSAASISPGTPTGVLADGRLVVAGAGTNWLYDPRGHSWVPLRTPPLSHGQGGSLPVMLASGRVVVHAGDQWAVLDPTATTGQSTSAVGLDSPILSWWLTVAALTLALVVGLQFAIAGAAGWRSARQSR